jgi:hypothetical protein
MNLQSACEFLCREELEITPAKIGRLTAKMHGGPKPQSILNNVDFVAYVYARQSEQGTVALGPQLVAKGIRTGDNRVDAYIQTLELELKSARQDLGNLRKTLSRNCVFDFSAAMKGQFVVVNGNNSHTVSESEKNELRLLLEQKHLAKIGLELSQGGQLRTSETLRTLLGPDGVRALQRLTSA